jgi:hypothetical protein
MKKLVLLSSMLVLTAQAQAAPIVMEGDYVKTAVSDNGTLGYGGTTSPGILHDPTGTGTYGIDDYLTPGTPFEGFSVYSAETGVIANNNSSYTGGTVVSGSMTGSISDISGTYDQAVNYTGSFGDFFSISTDTYFNDGDERISMTTTITAMKELTDVSFARWLDPDPDVRSYGSYFTENGRGATGLAAEDWVHSEGVRTGLTIGLYSDSDVEHNTSVIGGSGDPGSWSVDPRVYLAGYDDGDGDYSIGLAFMLDDMLKGDSITFTYHYVMGDSLDTVDIPDTPGAVPVPAAAYLFAPALLGLMGLRRKAKQA